MYVQLLMKFKLPLACTFSCRLRGTIKDLLTVKLCVSMINVTTGLYFLFLYIRYSKRITALRVEKRVS